LGDGGGAPASKARSRKVWKLAAVAICVEGQWSDAHGRCSIKCSKKRGDRAVPGVDIRRNRQNWPIIQTWAQNEPSFKQFHKITLFSSTHITGAMLSCITPYTSALSSWPRGAVGPTSGTIAPKPGALCP
jgi:hypothetical protein